MANRIDNAVDALEAQLAELVAAKTLAAVKRELLIAGEQTDLPVLGLFVDEARRRGGSGDGEVWEVECLLMLATRAEGAAADQAVFELVGAVQGKIDEFNAADGPGGVADLPHWQTWIEPGRPVVPCGAIGTLRLTVDGTIAVT